MSDRAPCVKCGMILHTGEGRVTISFRVNELSELALATSDKNVRDRLLCAIGMLDPVEQQLTYEAIIEAYGDK